MTANINSAYKQAWRFLAHDNGASQLAKSNAQWRLFGFMLYALRIGNAMQIADYNKIRDLK